MGEPRHPERGEAEEMEPNTRTLAITRVRCAGSSNAEPMRPHSGTSHTV
ncbi:hypothetical protein GCM10025881_13300 [Pseudolysinimonas kribbensis]|uniref:Uncharacterized protein n=1 Tax=Pseudolysinimonas kribbensis TaxID=433641 RepID=A0ABQ6K6V3_9MICO|nr:hypothetical protein GCM10025881_13300 [Pseudolysinimonas kribbensis]